MDQPAFPSAAELGVSDGEYERIMLDLRQRHGYEGPPPSGPPSARSAPGRGRTALLALGVLGLVAALRFFLQSDPDPVYAFTNTYDGERPITYTSCRPIQVAVYPADGPPDAEALVREAVGRMRSATGLDIVVVGAFGGHAPNWNFEAGPTYPDDPISVSWQDADSIAELSGNTIGLGGSRIATSAAGTQHLVAGTVALSDEFYASLAERGDHAESLAVLLHEFGHVFGLAHVDSRNELMAAENSGRKTFGTGDLRGLRLLGKGPCT